MQRRKTYSKGVLKLLTNTEDADAVYLEPLVNQSAPGPNDAPHQVLSEEDAARIAWAFFEREKVTIAKLLSIKVRQYRGGAQEMLGEIAFRLPMLIQSYRPGRGTTLRTHVYIGVNWYLYKLFANSSAGQWGIPHAGSKRAKKRRHENLDFHDAQEEQQDLVSLHDEVQSMLSGIDPYQRSLLIMRFSCEMTYEQMACALGVTKSIAREYLLEALAAVRRTMPTDVGASDACLEWMSDVRRALRTR